jgi:hypothetical protein
VVKNRPGCPSGAPRPDGSVHVDERLIDALDEQVELYRKLAKLAELQHVHVEQEQTEPLLEVLLQRQRVLDALSSLQPVMAPIRRDWQAFVSALDPALRPRAEAAMAETRRLLEQITTADRNDALVLQQRKLNLGRQINQARAARQVNRSYATAAYGSRAAALDVKGG